MSITKKQTLEIGIASLKLNPATRINTGTKIPPPPKPPPAAKAPVINIITTAMTSL